MEQNEGVGLDLASAKESMKLTGVVRFYLTYTGLIFLQGCGRESHKHVGHQLRKECNVLRRVREVS